MKKPDDEPRDEYDFRYGNRGRHHRKPTSEAVNAALRALVPTAPEDD